MHILASSTTAVPSPVQNSQGLKPLEGELTKNVVIRGCRKGWVPGDKGATAGQPPSSVFCALLCVWTVLEPGSWDHPWVIRARSLLDPRRSTEITVEKELICSHLQNLGLKGQWRLGGL